MKYTWSFFLCLTIHLSYGQVLQCDPYDSEERVGYNPEYIKANDIQSVFVLGQIKKRGEGIYSSGQNQKIEFDAQGRVLSKSLIEPGDTAWTELYKTIYMDNMKSQEIKTQQAGAAVYDFSYGPNGELIEIVSGKSLVSEMSSKAEEYIYIGVERFEWVQLSPFEKQKMVLNSLGKPYLRITYTYDSTAMYLKEIKQTYTVSKRSSSVYFNYDEKGRLSEEISGDEVKIFTYDDWNNILSEVCFELGVEKHRKEFVYDSMGKLSGKLLKYAYSPTVYIDKYTYEFRQGNE